MKTPYLIAAGLFLWLFFSACEARERQAQLGHSLLHQRLQERLEVARQQSVESCKQRLLDSALYIVDSIRVLEIKAALDTINRPFKPTKPDYPGPVESTDTLIVKPLFPDTVTKKK
jgi:hypothetical protein